MSLIHLSTASFRLLCLALALISLSACQSEREDVEEPTTLEAPCTGEEDGTVVNLGDPSGCEYPSACAEKGSSTAINEVCESEQGVSQIETQDCTRDTDGKLIATGEPGSCQFESTCAEIGYTVAIQIFCRSGLENEENLIEYGCDRDTDGLSCNDENVCTTISNCVDGECRPTETLNCDDSNPCTDDDCDATLGCLYSTNTGSCSDGDACTGNDQCVAGTCIGTPLDCVDDNPCTAGSCIPGEGCVYVTVEGECDDGNACTSNDSCQGGVCTGGSVITCNDDNPCTTDTCKPSIGCENTNNTLDCDDGNACTQGDRCSDGTCLSGSLIDCNDDNPCTSDSCSPSTGCSYADADGACNDADVCTLDDLCVEGQCTGLSNLACDEDDNPCTAEYCDPELGCQTESLDGVVLEVLSAGDCSFDNVCDQDGTQARNVLICRNGSPEEERDIAECLRETDGVTCDDLAFCTVDDACLEGVCTGRARDCNDENSCTTDLCSQSLGCYTEVNEAICDADTLSCQELRACQSNASSTEEYEACIDAASETAINRNNAIESCALSAGCGSDDPDPVCVAEFCSNELTSCLGPDGLPNGSESCASTQLCLDNCAGENSCRADCLAETSAEGFVALIELYECGRSSLCQQLDGSFDVTCLEEQCSTLTPTCFE